MSLSVSCLPFFLPRVFLPSLTSQIILLKMMINYKHSIMKWDCIENDDCCFISPTHCHGVVCNDSDVAQIHSLEPFLNTAPFRAPYTAHVEKEMPLFDLFVLLCKNTPSSVCKHKDRQHCVTKDACQLFCVF